MNSFPIEQGEQLRVGTVDFVSPNEIRALLGKVRFNRHM